MLTCLEASSPAIWLTRTHSISRPTHAYQFSSPLLSQCRNDGLDISRRCIYEILILWSSRRFDGSSREKDWRSLRHLFSRISHPPKNEHGHWLSFFPFSSPCCSTCMYSFCSYSGIAPVVLSISLSSTKSPRQSPSLCQIDAFCLPFLFCLSIMTLHARFD